MARSAWKGPFVSAKLIDKVEKVRESGRTSQVIQTWARSSMIIPLFVGFTFGVHNGKKFIPVSVTEDMVGHKFGEFSGTRTYHGHGIDKKKK